MPFAVADENGLLRSVLRCQFRAKCDREEVHPFGNDFFEALADVAKVGTALLFVDEQDNVVCHDPDSGERCGEQFFAGDAHFRVVRTVQHRGDADDRRKRLQQGFE